MLAERCRDDLGIHTGNNMLYPHAMSPRNLQQMFTNVHDQTTIFPDFDYMSDQYYESDISTLKMCMPIDGEDDKKDLILEELL